MFCTSQARTSSTVWKSSCTSAVVMMSSAQDREGENLAICVIWWNWYDVRFWYLLLDSLVGSSSIEVLDIGAQHSVKLLLIEDEHMIEALAPHTQEKAFTDSVRSRCVIRCCENLDPTRVRNPCEAHPKLAIVIPKKVFRLLSPRRGFPNRYVRSKRRWDIV